MNFRFNIVLVFCLLGTPFSYSSSLQSAQDELNIDMPEAKENSSFSTTSFSTVEVKQNFTEVKQLTNNRLSFGFGNRNINSGLLADKNTSTSFSKINSFEMRYIHNLNESWDVFVKGAYGISQSSISLLENAREKVNFNMIQLSSGLSYVFYKSSLVELKAAAGLSQFYLVQVSESGLRDEREKLFLPEWGLSISSPYFYQDTVRLQLSLQQLLGPVEEKVLIGNSSILVNAEIKL